MFFTLTSFVNPKYVFNLKICTCIGGGAGYSKSGTYVQKWVLGCFKDQRVPPSVSRKNVIRVPQGTRLIEGGGTPFFGAGLVVLMVYGSMGGGMLHSQFRKNLMSRDLEGLLKRFFRSVIFFLSFIILLKKFRKKFV